MDMLYRAFRKEDESENLFVEQEIEEEEDMSLEPQADIRVQNIVLMFAANAIIHFTWFLIIGILYYLNDNTWAREVGVILISSSVPLFVFWYFLMIYVRTDYPIIATISICMWIICGGLMLGSISVLTHKIFPIQLVLLLLFQSLSVMGYAKFSPRMVETLKAMAFMFIITLMVWASFIFSFVEENDWVGGIIILAVSIVAILYHGWQIRMSEGRYNLSWNDIRLSIIQFYGDPYIYAYSEIIKRMDK